MRPLRKACTSRERRHLVAASVVVAILAAGSRAHAEPASVMLEREARPASESSVNDLVPPRPPPFLYTVPWQLRPLPAPRVIRFDTSFAFSEDAAARRAVTTASILTLSVPIPGTGPKTGGLALVLRGAMVEHGAPDGQR